MLRIARVLATAGLFVLLVGTAGSLSAQAPPPKKVLTFADENLWRTASPPAMSPDGSHVAYAVWPTDGDGESIVRHIATAKQYTFPRGPGAATSSAKFTPDGKRAILPLTPTKAETDKAKADKVKTEDLPQPTLAVVELATGNVSDKFHAAGAFLVGGDGAGFLIYRKPTKGEAEKTDTPKLPTKGKFPIGGQPPLPVVGAGGKTFGSDLFIRDIASKNERTLPDVTGFQLTRDGKLLVFTVSSKKEETNGVFALNPRSGGGPEAIKTGSGRFSSLTWEADETRLAFLYDDSTVTPANQAPPPRPAGTPVGTAPPGGPVLPAKYHALVWERNKKPVTSPATMLPMGGTSGFAALLSVARAAHAPSIAGADEVFGPSTPGQRAGWTFTGGSLAFSADGAKLYLNTAPKREPAPVPLVGPPRPEDFQLDLWHWKDERLQPMQKLQAAADAAKTYSAVVLLDTKQFRQLSDLDISVSFPPRDTDWALGADNRSYRHVTGYGLPLTDYTAVNVRTGESKPLLAGFGGYTTPAPTLLPGGKHLLAFDGKDWFTVAVPDGKRVKLTATLKEKFFDEDDDHPGAPPPAGQPAWTPDGKFVLVNDRYDLWKLAADGTSAENLTKVGRGQQIRFSLQRVVVQDTFEPFKGFDLSKPQLLFAENLHTRDTGYYHLEPGAAPKLLIMGARKYGSLTKAKNSDVCLLTVQTFSDYPDTFATTLDFHEFKRVTDINPKVKDFNWCKAELVHFSSTDGTPLSGVLVKPENFDASKKYPMMVYIYERESDTLHNFRLPVVRGGQTINPTFYASNGYLVLMPDIAYKVGFPGQSAIKCVLPAIQAVVDKGYVDTQAIGINGQSWGGYQIAYMVTQTDRFKAAVAGAPVSNMVSAYGGIRWGSGLTRQFQYEWTQSRIGATLWDAPMKFIENSPVFMADRVKTPLLMIHNDQDDAVPWYQGIEYYLALRRLGKECYLLNYNGQPHNLANRAAARDFAARMFQFFEFHLKGKPAPTWMTNGVPYLDRDADKDEIKKLLGPEKK